MEHVIHPDRGPETAGDTRQCTVAIKGLSGIGDFAACVGIQRVVWGWSDLDIMPIRLFVLMQHVGGLVLGAYDDVDELVGFVNCVPGIQDGQAFWHSHMMAVLPEWRDRGIGTALKLAQRAHALDHGIHSIQWVFDPLEARNAYLNIAKLGAVVRRYSINHYGASTSRLHAGLDSDRLIAEWQLAGPKIVVRSGDTRKLAVPADIQALRRVDLPAARALQLAVRRQFLGNLSDGFVVVGCERHSDRCEYVFQRQKVKTLPRRSIARVVHSDPVVAPLGPPSRAGSTSQIDHAGDSARSNAPHTLHSQRRFAGALGPREGVRC